MRALLTIALALCSSSAVAAITVGTTSSNVGNNTNTISVSVTVGTLTNGCLDIDVTNSDGTPAAVSSVSVNSSTSGVTQVFSVAGSVGNAAFLRASKYYKCGPSSGTYNVTATFAATQGEVAIGVTQLQGVDQASTIRGSAQSSSNDATPDGDGDVDVALSVTSVAGDYVSSTLNAGTFEAPPMSATPVLATLRWDEDPHVQIHVGGFYQLASGTSTNMGMTLDDSGASLSLAWVLGAAAFIPASGGGGGGVNLPAIFRHLRQMKQ